MFEIALAARDISPREDSAQGAHVLSLGRTLSPLGRVTLFTSAAWRNEHRRMTDAGDPAMPAGVRWVFIEEEGERGGFYSEWQQWSARLFEAVARTFPDGGPDLLELSDRRGEGLVALQASRTLHPALRRTRVLVRLDGTEELRAALNGTGEGERDPSRSVWDQERISLSYADRLLHPGGDVLGSYERWYGHEALAPAVCVPPPSLRAVPVGVPPPPAGAGPLRLLYAGPLERPKGVDVLLEAVTGIPGEGWTLTVAGTNVAADEVTEELELAAAADQRISLRPGLRDGEAIGLAAAHHLLVAPSRWDCWPQAVLGALSLGRPVLGTPVGGLVEMVRPGASGWLTRRAGEPLELADAIRALVEDPAAVRELTESGAPLRVAAALSRPDEVRSAYRALAGEPRRWAPRPGRRRRPLVSVVVPYFQLEEFVERALSSVFEQDHRPLEVIVVNDGSLREPDAILGELATRLPIRVLTQANSGLGPARNAGIAQASGRYVLPMDADNELAPEFVSRCVEVLEADPELVYVTSWSAYMDERGALAPEPNGYQPLGNLARLGGLPSNRAGDATAVLRRDLFDRGFAYTEEVHSFEDWLLYRRLRTAGLYGAVIPERLIRYRVRSDSMVREVGFPQAERLDEEMEARLVEAGLDWLAPRQPA